MDTNLTDLEIKLLRRIALDDYAPGNGAYPHTFEETGPVWSFVLKSKADGGVFSSLKQKGLVDINKVSPRDKAHGDGDTVWMTEAGFEAFLKHCPEGADE